MKIEVRNININQSLSEETYAYTATVYVDGVKAFAARNSGTGGADRYDKLPGYGGPSLEEIIALQAEILERVADKVKPGGRLVYATCSLFSEENEKQVEGFLSRHPEYTVLPLQSIWEGVGDAPCDGDFLRLTPEKHATDGFFAAVLQRNA